MKRLERQSPHKLLVINVLLLMAIWLVDYFLIRVDLGLSIFYVLPIAIVAWFVSPKYAYGLCLLGAVLWLTAETVKIQPVNTEIYLLWNTAVRLIFWLIVTALLAELQTSYRNEQYLASTDFLTGLLNRRAFIDVLTQEIQRSQRYRLAFTLVYFDVDNFKQVNDQLGHAAGDRLLRAIAQVLQQALRNTDCISRMGGDEFTILLPQTNLADAQQVLSRVFDELTHLSRQQALVIGFSMGAVTFLSPPLSADEALAVADQLMYRIKTTGKNKLSQVTYPPPSCD